MRIFKSDKNAARRSEAAERERAEEVEVLRSENYVEAEVDSWSCWFISDVYDLYAYWRAGKIFRKLS